MRLVFVRLEDTTIENVPSIRLVRMPDLLLMLGLDPRDRE